MRKFGCVTSDGPAVAALTCGSSWVGVSNGDGVRLRRNDRGISAEEVFELRVNHPDWVAMQTRQKVGGTGEIRLRYLVKESLRMQPSRIIVGEVRAEECLDLLLALNAGLPGMASLHANSAREALVKMCTLPLLAGAKTGETGECKSAVETTPDHKVRTRALPRMARCGALSPASSPALRQDPDTCSDHKRNSANEDRCECLAFPALRSCTSPSL